MPSLIYIYVIYPIYHLWAFEQPLQLPSKRKDEINGGSKGNNKNYTSFKTEKKQNGHICIGA